MLDGTAASAVELKQQGALDAARDPNSSVTAQDAETAMVNQAKAAGAAAFEFDPNATAAEKAAQARAQAGPLPTRKHQVAALVTDEDSTLR